MGIFLNQLYKYREVDSACFYDSRGPGKNTKNCSDLKFGQKEGPKTGNSPKTQIWCVDFLLRTPQTYPNHLLWFPHWFAMHSMSIWVHFPWFLSIFRFSIILSEFWKIEKLSIFFELFFENVFRQEKNIFFRSDFFNLISWIRRIVLKRFQSVPSVQNPRISQNVPHYTFFL